jgi:hypothetical protein
VCGCSDHAAHYHNLGQKLGASLLTRHIGWKQKNEKEKKGRDWQGISTHEGDEISLKSSVGQRAGNLILK